MLESSNVIALGYNVGIEPTTLSSEWICSTNRAYCILKLQIVFQACLGVLRKNLEVAYIVLLVLRPSRLATNIL